MNNVVAGGESSNRRAWVIRLVLLFPAVAYVGIALHRRANPLFGDEPRYVAIAESIVRDGDVAVENNYTSLGFPWTEVCVVKSPRGYHSMHGLGLPLLIAPGWFVGGAPGVRIWLSLLTSLVPFIVYRVVAHRFPSPGWSLLVTLTISLGMPFADGADQIYPDLPSGLMLLYAANFVVGRSAGINATRLRFVAFVAIVAFLPCLHIKQAAPAFVLLVGYLGLCRMEHPIRRFVSAAVLIGSLSGLACYNHYAFANPLGPYGTNEGLCIDLPKNVMIFFGLHWDQAQGMFLQQPFFLLGLVGIGQMWRNSRRILIWLALLGASLLVPNCLHPNLYGGGSLAGRFAWSSVLLWCFPVSYAARRLFERSPRSLVATCAVCLLLQFWLAGSWLRGSDRLLQGCLDTPLWAYNGLYPALRDWLPFWHCWESQWQHGPNYTFLLFGALLWASSWLTRERCRAAWATMALVSLALHPLRAPDVSWVPWHTPSGAPAGVLAIVPSLLFKPGDYQVKVEYAAEAKGAAPVGKLHVGFVAPDGQVKDLPPTGSGGGECSELVHVNLRRACQCAFVAVLHQGPGAMMVKRISIEPPRR